MSTGIKSLRKNQFGKETVAGTAVAATTIWRGTGLIENTAEFVFPEEDIGYVSGVDRQYVPMLGASLSLDSTPATFEQILHVFEAGVLKVTTGAANGAGSGKVYTYPMPTTNACDMSSSTRAIQPYTIESGDNNEVEEMEYSFVESFNLSGNPGESVMIASEWRGRQTSNSSFTTAATLPTVEEILFSKGKIYIDAEGGTIGTTQVTNTWLNFNLDVTTGLKGIATGDGNKYFSFVKGVTPEAVLTVTFENNASATTEKTNWENGTARLIRLLFVGTAFTTSGTYANKTLIVDLAGKWEDFTGGDDDGNDTVTGVFRARYNTTAALFGQFVVANLLTSVP